MIRRGTALLFVIIALASCSGLAQETHVKLPSDNYHDNLQRWQQAGWQDYDISYQRQCFCLPEHLRPLRVELRRGKITNAVYADDGSALDPEINYWLKSVDDWFELISEAILLPAAEIQVSYDEKLGFPVSIFIDYHKRIADDEIMVRDIHVIKR